ncbi:MAG: tetratricopeptide repeat protein [Crocinitomicaceae bacterium]|nr:tetratricopeptide repeat protein [Crocinitomicaceae bacterium]
MKTIKILLSGLLLFGLQLIAQEDECTRFKAIAGNAYQAKNFEKVVTAYNRAQQECGTLDMKFYNPYIYSVKMAMRNASDNEGKAAYLDTLLIVYEKAQAQHGLQKDWQSYIGYSYMMQGKPGFMKRADEAYQIGVHHEGPKVNEGMLKQYYSNLYNLWVQETDEDTKENYKMRLITEFFQLSDYVNKGNMSNETLEFLALYLDKVVTDCAVILPSIKTFLGDLPQEVEAKKLTINNFKDLLEKKNCTTSEEYAMIVDTIIKIDPSVRAVLARASLLIAQNKTSEAIKTFEEALKMSSNVEEKSDIELAIAEAHFRARNYRAAHTAGLKVTGKNSPKGYEIAAKSVNALMNDCGASTFDRKANNYYAIELAEKSGNAQLVAIYKKAAPDSNDLFRESKEVGEEITLECWGRTFKIVLY